MSSIIIHINSSIITHINSSIIIHVNAYILKLCGCSHHTVIVNIYVNNDILTQTLSVVPQSLHAQLRGFRRAVCWHTLICRTCGQLSITDKQLIKLIDKSQSIVPRPLYDTRTELTAKTVICVKIHSYILLHYFNLSMEISEYIYQSLYLPD